MNEVEVKKVEVKKVTNKNNNKRGGVRSKVSKLIGKDHPSHKL